MVQHLVLRVQNVIVLGDDGGFEPKVIFFSIGVVELPGLFNKQPRVEVSVSLK